MDVKRIRRVQKTAAVKQPPVSKISATHSPLQYEPASPYQRVFQAFAVSIGPLATRIRPFTRSKRSIGLTIGATLLASSLTAAALLQYGAEQSATESRSNGVIENLEYQTVLPANKSIQSLGGWRRVSPPKAEAIYAYSDTIDGVPISVTQQPLPVPFDLNEMARRFSATKKIDADGSDVYLGVSSKGPQSAVFTENGLLILIKSERSLADKSWANYISSLR